MDHLGSLRVSLLLAIGVVPVACGGSSIRGGETNGSGGTTTAGSGPAAAGTNGKMLPPTTGGMVNGAGGAVTGTGGGVMVIGGSNGMGGATGSGGGKTISPTCTAPKLDNTTGLVLCREGYRHRPHQVECGGLGGAAPAGEGGQAGGGDGPEGIPFEKPRAPEAEHCGSIGQAGAGSNDCSQYELGYCELNQTGICRSGCYADEDCGPGYVCACGHPESPSGGVCAYTAGCRIDADCGVSGKCATFDGGCGEVGYACLSPLDKCRSSADCGEGYCSFSHEVKHRVCEYAVCGRPFLVDDMARVASPMACADWATVTARRPQLDHLTLAEREALARHWTRMGQLEHASIAAFARFSLQLLSLGAPPELVQQCTQALADETAHARLCFELASAYAGRAIGPGPLDVSGSLQASSFAEIVDLVIAEGCYGETSAALEAREAAVAASDPVIAAAYRQIAADEQRHAELAFRFVRWALEREPGLVRARVAAALAQLPTGSAPQQVVRPCLEALLALPVAA